MAENQEDPQKSLSQNVSTPDTLTYDLENQIIPPLNVRPGEKELAQLTQDGKLTPITKKDLLPKVASAAIFNQKDADGHDLPIYVKNDYNIGESGAFSARRMLTNDGKPIILTDNDNYKWPDEAYVREHIMPTEASLQKEDKIYEVKRPEVFLAESLKGKDGPQAEIMRSRYNVIMNHLAQNNSELGIDKVAITSEITGTTESKEGNKRLYLNDKKFTAALASDEKMNEFLGSIDHEKSHVRHGDKSASGLLKQQDNLPLTREIELRSDLEGSGPLGTHNPEAKARDFKTYTQSEIPDYIAHNPGTEMSAANPTSQDLKNVSAWIQKTRDPEHPAPIDRVDALQEFSGLMQKYEAANPSALNSREGRQAESDFLVGQVMHDMKAKVDRDPYSQEPAPSSTTDKALPHRLSQSQLDSILRIRGELGNVAPQAVINPVTSASIVPTSISSGKGAAMNV